MNRPITMLWVLLIMAIAISCSGPQRYHQQKLGSPSEYQAHFPDMDANGDELVHWQEFKAYFPQTNQKVFNALDMNKDTAIDHDEWHEFKAAHGMRDH